MLFYSDFYDDLEKKTFVRPIHKESKWYLGHFLFDLVIFQCDYYILLPNFINTVIICVLVINYLCKTIDYRNTYAYDSCRA